MIIDSIENKQQIIENLLEIVAFEGWSDEALKLAMQKTQIDEKYLELIFEDKIYSAAKSHSSIRDDIPRFSITGLLVLPSCFSIK